MAVELFGWVTLLVGIAASVLAVGGMLVLAYAAYVTRVRKRCAHLPNPPISSFFLGHIPELSETIGKDGLQPPVTDLILKWYNDLGSPPLYVLFLMWKVFVVSFEPQHLQLLSTPRHPKPKSAFKYFQTLFKERLLGQGLLSILEYEEWKPRRRLYDPAFNKSHLKTLVPSFCECVNALVEKLIPLADGKTQVPMKQELKRLAVEVITKVGFSMNVCKEEDFQHSKGNKSLQDHVSCLLFGLQKQFRFPFPYEYLHPFEVCTYRESIRAVRKIGRDAIRERIAMFERGDTIPRDILSHILTVAQNQESIDIEVLVDDFVTFFVAGYETTGNLLAFTLILILQHPYVLHRMLEEIDEVLEGKKEITGDDLEKLKYMEQVLQESLRLYPPAGGQFKESPPEGLTLGDYYIPGYCLINFLTLVYGRMSKYYEDPNSFNPDRFGPGKTQPDSFVYFPFGVGHRSCIGKHFAMMEAKLALACLFQTFKFSLPPGYKVDPVLSTTLQPRDDVLCTLQLKN